MFPDSLIAKNVSIGSEKMSYMLAYLVGPYFCQLTITEIMKTHSSLYILMKTVTAEVRIQVDLLVCYWSETYHKVKVGYLPSVMFGHSKPEDVVKQMLDVLNKLAVHFKLMISLQMDSLNVKRSIVEKLHQVKREKGFQPLVKYSPRCLFHVCYSSFQKGLAKYRYSAEKLCFNLYYLFKRSSCRRKDLLK